MNRDFKSGLIGEEFFFLVVTCDRYFGGNDTVLLIREVQIQNSSIAT